MANKIKELTPVQYKAIQLALQGKNWATIAKEIEVSESALWQWRARDKTFQSELRKQQEAMLHEVSLQYDFYMKAGYKELYNLSQNAKEEKVRLDASQRLIELPMQGIEKLKILEHNRRELEIEDELNKPKEPIPPETAETTTQTTNPDATKKKPRSNRKR